MRRRRNCLALFVGLVQWLAADTASAALAGLERVTGGLTNPMFVLHAPGDPTRLFIGQRSGAIRIFNFSTGMLEPAAFLSIPSVDQAGEGGLLGMAFHPDYFNEGTSGFGKFYVNVTIDNGGLVFQNEVSPFSTHIREYTVSTNPNVANTGFTPILNFIQPQSNHNAGWIGFSPNNGYLYIPTGDGGGANDRDLDGGVPDDDGHTPGTGNAQDITDNFLGKILRIDVDSDDFPGDANRNYAIPADNPYVDATGDDEIWAIGMRNPFRDSFDSLTGDLWIGDVGQDNREEIDRQPADAPAAENFGWRLREGNIQTPGVGGAIPANYRAPVYDYLHGSGSLQGNAVIGGYVYRGPDPSLQGQYFFADEVSSHKWVMNTTTFAVQNLDGVLTPDVGTVSNPGAFGEDPVGNLYLVAYGSGNVFRIKTNELLPGDYNADGEVDDADYAVWQGDFGSTTNLDADGNSDNIVNAADFTVWRDNFGRSVHNLGAGSSGVSVPEPAAFTLFGQVLGLMLLGRCRRRFR